MTASQRSTFEKELPPSDIKAVPSQTSHKSNPMGLFATQKMNNIPLNCTQRPKEIQDQIQHAFEACKRKTSSRWGLFNADEKEEYGIAAIKEYSLIKSLILKNPDRSEFYVLDIGAGNFGFCEGLAKFLNKDKQLSSIQNIRIHILGVRGETFAGQSESQENNCVIHKLGAFQVENMVGEFDKLKMDLKHKIDVAVSRWCFQHLIDPVGTFLQVYNDFLRPETGLFLIDGFRYNLDSKARLSFPEYVKNMYTLLSLTGAEFLIYGCESFGTLNQFVIRKSNEVLSLPLSYVGLTLEELFSNYGCVFHLEPEHKKTFNYKKIDVLGLTGHESLYRFISELNGFGETLFGKVKYYGPFLLETQPVQALTRSLEHVHRSEPSGKEAVEAAAITLKKQ